MARTQRQEKAIDQVLCKRTLHALETSALPMSAIEISGCFPMKSLIGNRESRRRLVRRVVKALRESGHSICAGYDPITNCVGYWLARSNEEYREYLASRRSNARFQFVLIRRNAEAASDRTNKQQRLFA